MHITHLSLHLDPDVPIAPRATEGLNGTHALQLTSDLTVYSTKDYLTRLFRAGLESLSDGSTGADIERPERRRPEGGPHAA